MAARFSVLAWLILLIAGGSAGAAAPESGGVRRIVSLSPNVTETVIALGAGKRLVAVSDYCKLPPALASTPRAGGWSNPNFEIIAKLAPDAIFVLGEHRAVADFGKARGIRVVQTPMMSIATIRSAIAEIGEALGAADAATSLTRSIDMKIEAFRREAGPAKRSPPRVFISMTRQAGSVGTLFTVGKGTFLDEAVALAGGVNIFGDMEQAFVQVSAESLVARRPDVILELEAGIELSAEQRARLVGDWDAMTMLAAVRDKRIAVLTDDGLLIAGPRFPEIVEALRSAIRPLVSRSSPE